MKTKYKAVIAICCVLLVGCVTAAVILLMPNRTTADDGEEFNPADVDKFTVEDKYKDVLAEIKAEMPKYSDPEIYANMDAINSVLSSTRDYSITEESIAGRPLFDGHLFADWETSDFDDSTLMSLHIKEAIALQYRRYLCEQYVSKEYADDPQIKTWLSYRIAEVTDVIVSVRDEIDKNQPNYTGGGGEDLKPEYR